MERENYSRLKTLANVGKNSRWVEDECMLISHNGRNAETYSKIIVCGISVQITLLTEPSNKNNNTKFLDTCSKTAIDVTLKIVLFTFLHNVFRLLQLMITIQIKG
jgi:hypothetical protein